MADGVPAAAVEHYRTIQVMQADAISRARLAWRRIQPNDISGSWEGLVEANVSPSVSKAQVAAAVAGSEYSAKTLAQQGAYSAPVEFVDPTAFGGYAADGRQLDSLLAAPAYRTKSLIGEGVSVSAALQRGQMLLDLIVRSTVTDAARQAASVDIAARPGVSYVRMLNPPSCSRCSILAGRIYKWNKGFRRHPACDCVHVCTMVADQAEAFANGLIDDPYEYFKSLDEAAQDRVFGRGNARAVRDGADIYQTVNSARGLTKSGVFTLEGTSKRGYANGVLKRGQKRMTPDTIYRLNPTREAALADLKAQGYILSQGQVPGGAIVGANREGFGALGRGGTRRAASNAVADARVTGVRDVNSRYTMTEAERRLYDSKRRYETALSGRDPFTSPGFGSTPDPYGTGTNTIGAGFRPATPAILAQTETDYRRWLRTNGEIFAD